MKKSILFLLVMMAVVACNTNSKTEDSASLKEARQTYDRVMQIADESSEIAKLKLNELNDKRDSLLAQGDSVLAEKLHLLNMKLDSLEMRVDSYRKQAQEMKAHSSMKTANDDQEHHHHDHGATVNFEDFSDEELLELQLDMEQQVKAIKEEIESTSDR